MGLSDPPAAVVLDPLAAALDPGLDQAAGPGAAQRLRAELRARARRWAAETAPGRAFEANSVGAALAALDGHRGPAVLVSPDVPALAGVHARIALADLSDGIEIAVGSGHDARPFLVALAQAQEDLLEIACGRLEHLFAAVHERGLALSIIRHERRLVSAADALAFALDPLTPPGLAAELGRVRERPTIR